MAPKAKAAAAEEARRSSQQEAPPPDTSKGSTWCLDINDALRDRELPPDVLKTFKAKGHFWEDFAALCVAAGLVPHPCFSREPKMPEAPEDPSRRPAVVAAALLAARSILFDQPSMQVAKHVLPTSLHLETLMFSGCKLTVSQLGLLKAGLSDPTSAVQTLHVDWNPLERVLPEAAEGVPGELAAADLRFLRELCELLEDTFGDMALAVRKLGLQVNELANPETLEVVCAKDVPVDLKVWVAAFANIAADIPTDEVERAFQLLDAGREGLVAVERLQEARSSVAAGSPDEEVPDEVCTAFAQFADATSTLENLSFRCNRLMRLEAQTIGTSLGSCPHLRSLNLWGNRVCNSGAAALAKALEGTFVLQFLGLGKNLITHEGLQKICQSVGYTRIDSEKEATEIQKTLKDSKKGAPGKVVVKKDGRGRERFAPEPRFETCEEAQDPETGETYWLWGRNMALKTLALDSNPIADAAAVAQLRPLGPAGSFLVLRGTPCAKELAESTATGEASTGWTLVLK